MRLALALAALAAAAPVSAEVPKTRVAATAETAPIDGDADDPAIWVNPADPAASRIIGTDKTAGLRVYDLSGALLQTLDDGDPNNVDVRPYPEAGQGMSLIGATRREDDTLRFYLIGPAGEVLRTAPGTHPGAPPGPDGLACRGLVEVAAGRVDGVTETDGLDVTAAALPGHPQGLLVMMDDQNEGFSTNFKLIDWAQVAAGLDLTP